MPSTRLRAKTIILARNAYNAINIAFVNIVSYRQLSPAEWNWGLKSGFFWAGINIVFTTYIFLRLREFIYLFFCFCLFFLFFCFPWFSKTSFFSTCYTFIKSARSLAHIQNKHTAETKGRTYAELDILFENKVPARKFASTKIETLVAGTEGAAKRQAEGIVGE